MKVDEIFVGIQRIDNLYIKKDKYSNENVEIFYPDIKKMLKTCKVDYVGISLL